MVSLDEAAKTEQLKAYTSSTIIELEALGQRVLGRSL